MTTKITIMEAGPGEYVTAIRTAQPGTENTVIKQEKMSWGIIVGGGWNERVRDKFFTPSLNLSSLSMRQSENGYFSHSRTASKLFSDQFSTFLDEKICAVIEEVYRSINTFYCLILIKTRSKVYMEISIKPYVSSHHHEGICGFMYGVTCLITIFSEPFEIFLHFRVGFLAKVQPSQLIRVEILGKGETIILWYGMV